MAQIICLALLKLVSLAGATAQTIGFIGLFAFESLEPYRWSLLGYGTLTIIASESLSYLLAKRMAATPFDEY